MPLANPGPMHRLVDPDAGDTLLVVTAPPPTRGLIKRQDFVELSLLESVHGVVVHPNSDDVKAEVGADKVMLGRPGGLTLSSADVAAERATAAVRPLFDVNEWRKNQEEKFSPQAGCADQGRRPPRDLNSRRRPGSSLPISTWRAACIRRRRGVTNLILSETKQGNEDAPVHDGACGRQHPDRPSRARR